MRPERPPTIVVKYYLYRMTLTSGFTAPIYVVFLQSRGLSLTQVSTLSVVYSLTVVFGETPTGYLGDRVGRRNSLLVSVALLTVAMLAFGLASTFPAFVLVYVLWAVGMTFQSGSAGAWLYDVLRERRGAGQFARISGRAEALNHFVTAVASLLAGYIASIDLFLPFLATAVITGTGFFVVLSFPASGRFGAGHDDAGDHRDDVDDHHEDAGDRDGYGDFSDDSGDNRDHYGDDRDHYGDDRDHYGDDRDHYGDHHDDADHGDDTFTVHDAVPVVRDHLLSPSLRLFVVYTVLLFSVVVTVRVFVQPASVAVGLTVAQLGYLYAGLRTVSAAGSYLSGTVKERVGIRTWVHTAPVLLGALLAASAVVPPAVVPVFFVLEAVRTVTRPLQGQYINDRTGSVGRATVLSAVSMVAALAVVPFKLAGGAMADALGPVTAVTALGGVLLVGSVAILARDAPVKREPTQVRSAD